MNMQTKILSFLLWNSFEYHLTMGQHGRQGTIKQGPLYDLSALNLTLHKEAPLSWPAAPLVLPLKGPIYQINPK